MKIILVSFLKFSLYLLTDLLKPMMLSIIKLATEKQEILISQYELNMIHKNNDHSELRFRFIKANDVIDYQMDFGF